MRNPILSLFLASLVACGGEPAATPAPEPVVVAAPDPATDKAARIAAISVEIRANPDGYEAILKKHGMTSAQFEVALYEIAADPALSARYAMDFPAK